MSKFLIEVDGYDKKHSLILSAWKSSGNTLSSAITEVKTHSGSITSIKKIAFKPIGGNTK